jgi:uncharacterized protein (TIGR03083 family)
MSSIDAPTYLDHLRSESARFRAVLADCDPAARVPACPDWDAADLLWHLAEVQLFWGAIVRDRLDDPDPAEADKPDRPADYGELLVLFRDASAALVDALSRTPDDTKVWTWFPTDRTAGFVRRRQAHEALIHRVDAELTADAPVTGFDPALATDGVAEVVDWMYGGIPEWAEHHVDGPVGRLATTDTGARWLVRIGRLSGTSPDTGNTYTDEPTLTRVAEGDPSFSVAGAARDLDAWLWNRPTITEVVADGPDIDRFRAIVAGGVQ